MKQLLEDHSFILIEAAILERLRRTDHVRLHETLVHAPLIYDPASCKVMGSLYREYIDLAQNENLPLLLCTPTWRTNKERVAASNVPVTINQDAAAYIRDLCDSKMHRNSVVKVGGMVGCKNDCYRPAEGLSVADAQVFHSWQVEQLAQGGVDFLIAETLPNIQEALGIAKAMESTRLPYIISFVISKNGAVLDGSSLETAIDFIDSNTAKQPLGYMINCAHPSFLSPEKLPKRTLARLIGYQANASSLDHYELEAADELKIDSISEWGQIMLNLNEVHGIPILGGCCGTNSDHLRYLIKHRNGAH